MRGHRVDTHNVVRVRLPVTVMGVKTRSVVEVCRGCFAVGDNLRRYTCHRRTETWDEWKDKHQAEELVGAS